MRLLTLLQYEAEQDRVLWELNEAAGAIAQHTPHEQQNFYYDTVAGAASAFPVMSMRSVQNTIGVQMVPSCGGWWSVSGCRRVGLRKKCWNQLSTACVSWTEFLRFPRTGPPVLCGMNDG
ncbi:hypothetical protein DPX16_5077 [Anabarilius grahami]|uniref:Uncharacterized protein n=1 Tax=Anabarilius grahami TaxID=495550 RepID=A0A3N0XJ28_ANAGA|nr:hypothetical protein DPX16_5077 [Anabarilius grahami]